VKATAVVHCECGETLHIPIDEIALPFTCTGCGEHSQIEARDLGPVFDAYHRAFAEAGRQLEDGAPAPRGEAKVRRLN
jgi:hypothetical protein